ncbi:TPA: YopX family protein [Streptococcus suis]
MIPKFRFFGKVADGEMRMVTAHCIDFENGFIYYSYRSYTVEGDECADGDVIGLEDCVLMQSTGLKDKNGKEIFEGDILKCTSFDGSFWYETVLWDSTLAGFATQQNGYDATAISYTTDSKAIAIEVIGDIYRNPELLEEL